MRPPVLEPAAVYDVRDGSYRFDVHFGPLSVWLARDGHDLTHAYRIEVYLVDCPSAKIFRYERDREGRTLWDTSTQEPKKAPPVEVPLSSLPPIAPLATVP